MDAFDTGADDGAGRGSPGPGKMGRLGGVLHAGMILFTLVLAVPFVAQPIIDWPRMNAAMGIGTALLAGAMLCCLALNFSPWQAAAWFVLAAGIGWLIEFAGLGWGWPFGEHYAYHPAFAPTLGGGVPLFIPLAWFVLSCTPVVLLRGVSVRDAGGRWRCRRLLVKSALGATCLLGWDLVLDPLAVSTGAWTWRDSGGYFGIPYPNLAGWWVVGAAICLAGFVIEPRRTSPRPTRPGLDRVWAAANVAFLTLAAVATYNRLGSLLPWGLSMAVLGPFWAGWFASNARPSRSQAADEAVAVTADDGR